MDGEKPLRVCYFGTYRQNYSRNQMMIAGLRENGVVVQECHETLWHGVEDRVNVVMGGWKSFKFWKRLFTAYWRLLRLYRHINDYDVLVLGYPGQLDVYLARVIAWMKHKPLVWDILMSIYLISVERGLGKKNSLGINLIKSLEGFALKLPDLLIIDTAEYLSWFSSNYKINSQKFRLIPIGADDRIFFPTNHAQNGKNEFIVLYAGTYIPNHGVKYILEAAKFLREKPEIKFEMIGEGPDLTDARTYATQYDLSNVTFIPWIEKGDLIERIRAADVCLGVFGTTPQSLMTVQNKIYETMAMCKPLISGESPVINRIYTHRENIYLCDRASGKAISEAILDLMQNPLLREKISQNGYKKFIDEYSLKVNGQRFKNYLLELIS